MNNETYQALKVVVELAKESNPHEPPKEIGLVEVWVDEVAKEYLCDRCGASDPVVENVDGEKTCESCETKRTIIN